MKTKKLFFIALFIFACKLMFSQGNEWKTFCNGDVINSINQDTLNIIVGTAGGGVVIINKATLNSTYIKKGENSITSNQVNFVQGSLYDFNRWVATDKGFSYFLADSNKWFIYNHDNVPQIPLNRVTSFAAGYNDLFVVCNSYFDNFLGTWVLGGIGRLNNIHGWTSFGSGYTSSIFHNCIGLTPNKDQLFIGGGFGNAPPSGGVSMYRFADSTWSHIYTGNSGLPGDNINCIYFDSWSSSVLFGTDMGLAEHAGLDTLTGTNHWTIIDTSNSNLPDNNVTSIATQYTISPIHQYWWIGTRFGGLMRLDTYDGTWIVYDSSNSNLGSNNITSICIEYANPEVVWIGTDNGLYRFDQTTFTKITTSEEPIPSNNISDIDFDNNYNKWIATDKGLAKFKSNWTIYNPQNSGLKYTSPICVYAHDNDVWIGGNDIADGSLCKYDGSNWNYFLATGYPFLHSVLDITSDNTGNLWLASDYGVFKYTDPYFSNWNSTTGYTPALPSNYIKSIFADNTDSIWIGTNAGLAKKINGPWTVYNPVNSAIPSYTINAIAQDEQGHYWVATDFGLAKFDKQNNNWTVYDTNSANFGSMVVSDVDLEGDSLVWIASRKGVSSFNRTTQIWTNYNSDNSGVTEDIVTKIKVDPFGNKWIGTYRGGLIEFKGGGIASTINDISERHSEIKIYPNPFSNSTTIEISDSRFSGCDLAIYDMLGRVVHQQLLNSKRETINLNLPDGVYFYKISNEKKEIIGNGKLMIQ